MKSLFKRLAKNIFRPLWLTAAISKADAGIHKKSQGEERVFWTQHRKQQKTSSFKEEMDNIMKIVKCLEEYGLLIKGWIKCWISEHFIRYIRCQLMRKSNSK